jgi:hypothetical protein
MDRMTRLRALPVLAALLAMAVAGPVPAVAARDTTAPRPTAPRAGLRSGAAITNAGVPLRATWRASDPSGIARYRVQVRIDGGSWVSLDTATRTARSANLRVPAPHEAQLRVRATDRAGNTGPWVAGPGFRVRQLAESDPNVSWSGAWSVVHGQGFTGGTARRTEARGSSAALAFTGSQVAWVGRRAASGGRARATVAGAEPVIADLSTKAAQDRRLLATIGFQASAARTLAVASLGGGRTWVDGFVVVDAPAVDPVLVGAGDIALCGSDLDSETARLLDGIAGRVFAAGDTAYPSGSPTQFAECYGPTWGRWRLRTSPAPGNHEYGTSGASGYFDYFGSRAGPRDKGWYAYDLGTWRVYSLNANCGSVGCGPDSEQVRWLAADLAANPRACVAAVWHQPLFSSGAHGADPAVRTLWTTLDEAGADIVLNGHDHDYERFAAQDAQGAGDADGMVEFVVGTGGADLRPFGAIAANSLVRDHSAHGVLRLTLRPGRYDFAFIPVPGSTLQDSGSGACR